MTDLPHGFADQMVRKDQAIARWVAEMRPDFDYRFTRYLTTAATGCELWTRPDNGQGYGRVRLPIQLGVLDGPGLGGAAVLTHRVAWIASGRRIPFGMVLDHHDPARGCGNKMCANPEHLALATPRQNTLTGSSPAAVNAARQACLNGHQFSMRRDGKRQCAECVRSRNAERDELVRQAAAVLGVTARHYRSTFGRGKRAAESVLARADRGQQ